MTLMLHIRSEDPIQIQLWDPVHVAAPVLLTSRRLRRQVDGGPIASAPQLVDSAGHVLTSVRFADGRRLSPETRTAPTHGPGLAHKHLSAGQQGWMDGWVRWEEGFDSWGPRGPTEPIIIFLFLQDVAVSGVWQRRSCKSVGTSDSRLEGGPTLPPPPDPPLPSSSLTCLP